jgi:hypothetical protein
LPCHVRAFQAMPDAKKNPPQRVFSWTESINACAGHH